MKPALATSVWGPSVGGSSSSSDWEAGQGEEVDGARTGRFLSKAGTEVHLAAGQ